MTRTRPIPVVALLLLTACRAGAPQPAPRPDAVDLRPMLTAWRFDPQPQGARGTCSIFTTCESIEVALAKATGRAERCSPEFVNWAAGNAAGRPSDGNFFHNAIAGFERFGVCPLGDMPYQPSFDAQRAPSPEVLARAAETRDAMREKLAVRWIVPWTADHFGVADAQFDEILCVLAGGDPVAAGSGHSRLLVGYRIDPAKPGGGTFLTEDSALARFDEVTFDFVKKQVADVFWIEAVGRSGVTPR